MNEGATRELVLVLLVTAALLVFGIVAVALFVRQYRKEQKGRRK